MKIYAIDVEWDDAAFEALKDPTKPSSLEDANSIVESTLQRWGFTAKQGSLYLGDPHVDPVRCVLAIQHLTRTFSWFEPSIWTAVMLRIEDQNDLMPAIQAVLTSAHKKVTLAA